jgi:hypothetical protein
MKNTNAQNSSERQIHEGESNFDSENYQITKINEMLKEIRNMQNKKKINDKIMGRRLYLSTIILNVNGSHLPSKRHRLAKRIKKQKQQKICICCL